MHTLNMVKPFCKHCHGPLNNTVLGDSQVLFFAVFNLLWGQFPLKNFSYTVKELDNFMET